MLNYTNFRPQLQKDGIPYVYLPPDIERGPSGNQNLFPPHSQVIPNNTIPNDGMFLLDPYMPLKMAVGAVGHCGTHPQIKYWWFKKEPPNAE